MSDYVYESGLSTKRRRQRRTAITLLLTLVFLFGAFWWAWSYIRDGGEGATEATTPTAPSTICRGAADPRDVTINVYNATSINGLAGRVSNELTERGFTVGEVGNDPQDADIALPAELRYGDEGRPYAAVLKTIVEGPNLRPDGRADTSVDFVLGQDYTELLPSPAGIPTC